ncbi:MAG: hypothetical protein ACKOWG_20215 [Planctomycetia bacterium]
MTALRRFEDRLLAAALLACVLPAVGCKTGTSLAKPSWWTFGGTPKDADSLASAPPYGGDIKKPSTSAKPYPTTSTPSGYVIAGTGSPAGATPQQFEAAQAQSPVVYGSTPAPQATPAAIAAAPSSALPQQPAASSIAPQVGPYAALAGDTIPPPGQPLPPLAPSTLPSPSAASGASGLAGMPSMQPMPALPSETTLPQTAYSNFSAPAPGQSASQAASPAAIEPPPARMADARFADPAAALPAAALPAAAAGSRYSSGTGSRFSGAEAASFSPPSAAPAASYGMPSAGTPSATAFPTGPATQAPAGPAGLPAATPAAPGLLQPSMQPPAQPVRRPDPFYRPGGTTSYRPSRSLLADESTPASAPAASAVRTAAYDEPLAGTIQQ